MLRRILVIVLLLSLFVGVASAYEEHVFIEVDDTGGTDGDPGQGDTSPAGRREIFVMQLSPNIMITQWIWVSFETVKDPDIIGMKNIDNVPSTKRRGK